MRRETGLSQFEFAVVLAIFAVLAALLIDRLILIEQAAERLEVELVIRRIHTGLKLAIGEKLMRGREDEIAALLERDPLDFLERKVGAGETARWRYDPAERLLRYTPRQPEAFEGRRELAWRYVGHRDELGRSVGLRLEPVAQAEK